MSSADGIAARKPLGSRVACLVRWTFQKLPQLSIAGSFAGSALAMKLAPLLGVAPAQFGVEVLKVYDAFAALPLTQPILATLRLDVRGFIGALALMHLLTAALLVLPSGSTSAKLAGAWAVVAMAGAEYSMRSTGMPPPGTPPHLAKATAAICTVTHMVLLLCGIVLCLDRRQRSLGFVRAVKDGTFLGFLGFLIIGSEQPWTHQGSANGSEAEKEHARGREPVKADSGARRRRDMTPVPIREGVCDNTPGESRASDAGKEESSASDPLCDRGPRARAAAALGKM